MINANTRHQIFYQGSVKTTAGCCRNGRNRDDPGAAGQPMLSRSSFTGARHLTIIEKPLFSLLALFAARFSIKVFCGFFFSCFLVSRPLLIFVAPYDWV
jgi:hypothetical protein